MRKCAAVACAVLMLASACACGKKEPAPTTKTSIPMITTTTTTVIPTVTFPTEPDKEPLNLTFATAFSDGVALVRHLDGDGVEHAAAINTEGEVLFEMSEDMPFEGAGYKDGIRVVNNQVFDKTGALVAGPAMSGYDTLMTGSCGGFVVAQKTELVTMPAPTTTQPSTTEPTATDTASDTTTTTTGVASTTGTTTTTTTVTGGSDTTDTTTVTDATDTTDTTEPTIPTVPTEPPMVEVPIISVGVLNAKGEWVHPLSTDHPIAVAMANNATSTVKLEYLPAGVLRVAVEETGVTQYYHFNDNTMTDYYGQYASFGTLDSDVAGVYRLQADGTKELVVEGIFGDYFFSDIFIGREVIPATVFGDPESMGAYKIYDYSGKELADLSAYTFGGATGSTAIHHSGDYLTLPLTDEFGSRLLQVIDKQGNAVFAAPLALGMRDTLFPPDASGFVVGSVGVDGTATYRHYDYEGNVTEYTDVASFSGFSEGLAAVTLHGDPVRYAYINHSGEIVLH